MATGSSLSRQPRGRTMDNRGFVTRAAKYSDRAQAEAFINDAIRAAQWHRPSGRCFRFHQAGVTSGQDVGSRTSLDEPRFREPCPCDRCAHAAVCSLRKHACAAVIVSTAGAPRRAGGLPLRSRERLDRAHRVAKISISPNRVVRPTAATVEVCGRSHVPVLRISSVSR
jgi:hypothetical protein